MNDAPRERPVTLSLRARGPWAYFPDEAQSAASLPWPEPAACRALVESVLWKPRIRWIVRELHLLAPLRYARRPCPGDAPPLGLVAGQPLLALQDVDYRVVVDLHLNADVPRRDASDNHGKYAAMFTRRLEKDRGHHGAFFGLRALQAELLPDEGAPPAVPVDIHWGWMRGDWGDGAITARVEGGVWRVTAPTA